MSKFSWFGHRIRELLVHADRIWQSTKSRPSVIIFPGEAASGSASDLRATAVGKALKQFGWRSIVVPPQLELSQRKRLIRAEKPNIALLHQARHPLNRPRLYPGLPCVFDVDDADILDPQCRETVVDCCRSSVAIIAGSRFIANQCRPFNENTSIVWTTTYLGQKRPSVPNELRAPSIAWATTNPKGYFQEGEFIREILIRLAKSTRFTYHQYGVSPSQWEWVENFLAPIRRVGVPVHLYGPLRYNQLVKSLESVAVGLQPISEETWFSQGKSFGKLLAYLAADVAVVASDAVDHPLFIKNGINGMLLSNNIESWLNSLTLLLHDTNYRANIVSEARSDFKRKLTTETAARLVNDVLLNAIQKSSKDSSGLRSEYQQR